MASRGCHHPPSRMHPLQGRQYMPPPSTIPHAASERASKACSPYKNEHWNVWLVAALHAKKHSRIMANRYSPDRYSPTRKYDTRQAGHTHAHTHAHSH